MPADLFFTLYHYTYFYWFVTHTSRRTPTNTSYMNQKPPTLFPTHQTVTSYSPFRQLAHSTVPYRFTNVWFLNFFFK